MFITKYAANTKNVIPTIWLKEDCRKQIIKIIIIKKK